jgi:glycerophosphoryl diester phosphodiesterase
MSTNNISRLAQVSFLNWPYLKICAHRGAGKLAPENTLEAFQYGASFGHRMFEFDVKLSADNVSFLLHDDTLDRTTSGKGSAAGFTMQELVQLNAGLVPLAPDTQFGLPKEHVIRLPELRLISKWLLKNQFLANVEIKPSPGREAETGAQVAKECLATWSEYANSLPSDQTLIPPLLSSFSEVALAAAGNAVPELPRALLIHKLPHDWLDRCMRLDVIALDANFRELSPEVIAKAKANQLRVLSYTINDGEIMQGLFADGLDCAITDAVHLFRP